MPRLFFGLLEDNLILIPTVVLSLGRCPQTGKPAGGQIILSWLNLEIGLELGFYHD